MNEKVEDNALSDFRNLADSAPLKHKGSQRGLAPGPNCDPHALPFCISIHWPRGVRHCSVCQLAKPVTLWQLTVRVRTSKACAGVWILKFLPNTVRGDCKGNDRSQSTIDPGSLVGQDALGLE